MPIIPADSKHIRHPSKSNIPCHSELYDNLILMTGCIHLAFYTLKISLHRAIFRSVTEFNRSTPAYRPDAKLTAIRVLRFAKKLSSENIQAFWYPCISPPLFSFTLIYVPAVQFPLTSDSKVNFSTVGTFFLALLFTSREEEEVRELQRMMESYRWILRIHSRKSPGLTDLALSRLDSLLTITPTQSHDSAHNGVLSDPFLNSQPAQRPPNMDPNIGTTTTGEIGSNLGVVNDLGEMGDMENSPRPSGFVHELPRPEFGQVQGESPRLVVRKDIPLNDMAVPLNAFVDFDFEHWMREALLFGGDGGTNSAQNEGEDLLYGI